MTRYTTSCLPFTTIAFAVIVLSMFSETNAALVRFRSRVVVTGRIITLGDIAEVTDSDPAMITRLQRIQISPAPAAGRERRIAFETVRSRLSAVGVNLAKVEFSGNSVVTVTVSVAKTKRRSIKTASRAVERVPAWKIKRAEQLLGKAIGQYVARRAPRAGSVNVVVQLASRDVSRVLDGWTYGFDLQGGAGDLTGTQILNLRVMDRKSRIHELAVRCQVTPIPRIVVARHALPSGHVIQPADLTWRQAEAGAGGFTRMEAVIDKETRKPIRQGAQIVAKDVRVIPLVRPNDIVTVHSRVGGIVVTSRMKSRTAGTLGEMVTLVTLNGRQRVQARVSGYHEAEVLAAGNTSVASRSGTTGRVRFQRLPTKPQVTRQVDRRGMSSRSGFSGFRSGGTGRSIRPVPRRAAVSDRTALPNRTVQRSGLSLRSRPRKTSETEGVSEWRSLEPKPAVGRTDRAVNGKSNRRIQPAR